MYTLPPSRQFQSPRMGSVMVEWCCERGWHHFVPKKTNSKLIEAYLIFRLCAVHLWSTQFSLSASMVGTHADLPNRTVGDIALIWWLDF